MTQPPRPDEWLPPPPVDASVQGLPPAPPPSPFPQPAPTSPDAPPTPGPTIEERAHPASPLVQLWLGVVALAWFFITSTLQGENPLSILGDPARWLATVPWWFIALAGMVVVGLGFGYWSWWTTKFTIDDNELRIENRGAFQESKRIAFSRIQSVDVKQPFAARLLGLAQLSVDVGAGETTQLSFLTRKRAAELRDYLMVRAHGREAPSAESAAEGAAASAWNDLSARDQVLIKLNPGEIALGAFLSGELIMLTGFFMIPIGATLLAGQQGLALGALVPLGLAIVGFLGNRLFGQFNYTLAATPAGLRITRGLTTLQSQTIPAHRVQSIQISQPLIWRWLGRARLDVSVLGLGGGADDDELSGSTIFLPIGDARQVAVALASVWPGLRLDALQFTSSPRRARWVDPLAYRWQGYAWDANVLAVRLGWLNRIQLIVPHPRLQSMRLEQGPIARRLGLAEIALHTTNTFGSGKVPHLEASHARALMFAEMDRAKASRADELLTPPGLIQSKPASAPPPPAPWAPPPSTDNIWTPALPPPAAQWPPPGR